MAARRLVPLAAVVVASLACSDGAETEPTPASSGRSEASAPDRPAGGSGPATTTSPADPSVAPAGSVAGPSTAPGSSATGAPPATDAPPTTAPPVPDGPLGELDVLEASLSEDGTLGLLPALGLVAAGYGPIPGVTAAPQALADGGPALRAVLAHLDQLSGDQRQAVDAMVDRPARSLDEGASSASARLAKASGLVALAIGLFSNFLHRTLPADVQVTIHELPYANAEGTFNFSAPHAFATALPLTESTAVPYEECRIRINADAPLAGGRVEDPAFVSALAQEAFHCLQFGQRPYGEGVPMWALEGAAAFAGEDFAQGSALSAPWWERWIGEPHRSIDRRSYDAAGFFFLLQGSVDAYRYADAFLAEATEESVRRRLEATDVFDRWGSQYASEAAWGDRYTVRGAGVPATAAPQVPLALTVDGPPAAAGTATSGINAAAYRFAAPGDVLVVTAGAGDRGWLRFADGAEQPLPAASGAFCLLPTGCPCPGAAPESAPARTVASNEVFVGVGPSSGGGPELAARSLAQWCNEVVVPAPPDGALDPCLVGQWTSAGYVMSTPDGRDQRTRGGAGAQLALHADGTAHVVLDESTPVVITATDVGGSPTTTTTLEYRGAGDGRWRAGDGVLDVTGVATDSFSVRVHVESATGDVLLDATVPFGDARMAAYGGILGWGRYRCGDARLTLSHVSPGVGEVAEWTFST